MCVSSTWQFPLEYADQKSNDVRARNTQLDTTGGFSCCRFYACHFEPQVRPEFKDHQRSTETNTQTSSNILFFLAYK